MHLTLTFPKHPLNKDNPKRGLYHVVMDDGSRIKLPELCRRLRIPYSSLKVALKASDPCNVFNKPIQEPFFKILAEVRRRTHSAKQTRRRRKLTCPNCKHTFQPQSLYEAPTDDQPVSIPDPAPGVSPA